MAWGGTQHKKQAKPLHIMLSRVLERVSPLLRQQTLVSKLSAVVSLYREHLSLLFPGGHFEIESAAEEYICHLSLNVFSCSIDKVFTCLIIFLQELTFCELTHHNFSNFFHQDKNFIVAALGFWWTALESKEKCHYFSDKVDHSTVKGGAFA